jgi:uncharacterized protein YjbJ (UPF0337 family)
MMNTKWVQIATEWKRFRVEAKKKWNQLTDDELTQINGSRNVLAAMVQKRYFVTKKEAHDQIQRWMDELKT